MADMLARAIAVLRVFLRPGDTVVFTGDFVDRGPDSRGVIAQVLALRDAYPGQVVTLRGNHEEMMLDALDAGDPELSSLWRTQGGSETLQSYGIYAETDWGPLLPPGHEGFLRDTEMEWACDGYRFVHAGFPPPGREDWGDAPGWRKVDPRLWIREDFIDCTEDFGGVVVFGHTVQQKALPLIMENKVGIDTGAAFGGRVRGGGKLTVLACPSPRDGQDPDPHALRYFQVDGRGTLLF